MQQQRLLYQIKRLELHPNVSPNTDGGVDFIVDKQLHPS